MEKNEIENCKTLEALFQLWQEYQKKQIENTNVFIPDGYIDKNAYENCNKKILFILKESHYFSGNEISKLNTFKEDSQVHFYKQFINDVKYVNKFNGHKRVVPTDNRPKQKEKIARMAEYILHKSITSNYKTLKNALEQVAFMNINKMGGGDSTNPSKLFDYYDSNKDFIKKQISILKPDVIVLMINNEKIEEDLIEYWQKNIKCQSTDKKFIKRVRHTAARGKNLVLKDKEIKYFNKYVAKKYQIKDITELLNNNYQADDTNYFTMLNKENNAQYLRFNKSTLQYLIKFIYNYEKGAC